LRTLEHAYKTKDRESRFCCEESNEGDRERGRGKTSEASTPRETKREGEKKGEKDRWP